MTTDMRGQLEARARESWTSASQIARMAVARELDRQSIYPQKAAQSVRLEGLEIGDNS